MTRISRILCGLLAAALAPLASAAPVFDGVPTGTSANVVPTVMIGKAVVLPISVYDDSATLPPTIDVASDNPNIFVRVKTGNPLLKMHISHAANPSDASDAAYSGDAVFQLFNDFTPKAAGFIGGFAQAGFYDGLIFHRIADLNAGNSVGGPEFIFQGGDPGGSNPATAGQGGPGFTYDNEYHPALIFAGRGQLALANSGLSSSYRGTNGSQFFITSNPTRHLDFGYTILGQMTHGFPLLDKMAATPTLSGTDSSGNSLDSRPAVAVTIDSATVIPQYVGADSAGAVHTYTDGVLVISANRPGTATIRVISGSTTSTFQVTAAADAVNDPPFFVNYGDTFAAGEKAYPRVGAIDLERDYVSVSEDSSLLADIYGLPTGYFLRSTLPGTLGLTGNTAYQGTFSSRPTVYKGTLNPVYPGSQWHPGYRPGYDAAQPSVDTYYAPNVVVGVAPIVPLPQVIHGTPGVALTALAGRFRDANRAARPGTVTATINWGDGVSTDVAATGTVALNTGAGGYHLYDVSGTVTYAKAGQYPVEVTLSGAAGWTRKVSSVALISASPLLLTPLQIVTASPKLTHRPLATFIDTTSSTGGSPTAASYTATIDWGDGTTSAGQIGKDGAQWAIYGTHQYPDPEVYPVFLRLHRANTDAALDGTAWMRLQAAGFTRAAHLPPFPMAHVTGLLSRIPIDLNGQTAYRALKEIVGNQTYLSAALEMINGGTNISRAGTLRLYLARGTTVRKTPLLDEHGAVLEPADIPLSFGPSLPDANGKLQPQTSIPVRALPSGGGLTYYFQKSSLGDYRLRLPAGETGTGFNLIADLQYTEPLVPYLPEQPPTIGRIQGIVVSKATLSTSESGTTGTFTVALDRRPTAEVTIALTGDATEGSLSPSSLTFTSANWATPQTVTVTGLPDSGTANVDQATATYTITLQAAVSTDLLYNGLIGPTVSVTNADRDGAITVGALAGNNTVATVATAPTMTLAPPVAATTANPTPTQPANNTGTVTLVMNRKPTANVSVEVSLSNPSAAQFVDDGSGFGPGNSVVTFTPADFVGTATTASKTFHLQALADGASAVSYQVTFLATSDDTSYSGITPVSVNVTNSAPTTTTTSN